MLSHHLNIILDSELEIINEGNIEYINNESINYYMTNDNLWRYNEYIIIGNQINGIAITQLWYNNEIPYLIDNNYYNFNYTLWEYCINKYNALNQVKLREKNNNDKHYVKIVNNNECYSFIGNVSTFESPQILSLSNNCQSKTLIIQLLSLLMGIDDSVCIHASIEIIKLVAHLYVCNIEQYSNIDPKKEYSLSKIFSERHRAINDELFMDNIIGYNYTEPIFRKQYKYVVMKNGDWHLNPNIIIGNNKVGLDGTFSDLLYTSKRRLNPYLGGGYLWPNGIIPIDFTTRFSGDYAFSRSLFNAVVNEFRSKTNIKIIQRTTETDYIEIYPGISCSSVVGKSTKGGAQALSLPKKCWTLEIFTQLMMYSLGMLAILNIDI